MENETKYFIGNLLLKQLCIPLVPPDYSFIFIARSELGCTVTLKMQHGDSSIGDASRILGYKCLFLLLRLDFY